MRASVWKQDRKGSRWRRLGVLHVHNYGALPFKFPLPFGDAPQKNGWPRYCWYTMEEQQLTIFDYTETARQHHV